MDKFNGIYLRVGTFTFVFGHAEAQWVICKQLLHFTNKATGFKKLESKYMYINLEVSICYNTLLYLWFLFFYLSLFPSFPANIGLKC